ncbi:unnamed protein product [Cunninghamella echinulata]
MSDTPDKIDKKENAALNILILKLLAMIVMKYFSIKRSTPLRKLMDAYCDRQGKSSGFVRFLYDGGRLLPTNTPEELDMEDGDSIDVMIEQIGGYLYK